VTLSPLTVPEQGMVPAIVAACQAIIWGLRTVQGASLDLGEATAVMGKSYGLLRNEDFLRIARLAADSRPLQFYNSMALEKARAGAGRQDQICRPVEEDCVLQAIPVPS
jgi:hypothetical protein